MTVFSQVNDHNSKQLFAIYKVYISGVNEYVIVCLELSQLI